VVPLSLDHVKDQNILWTAFDEQQQGETHNVQYTTIKYYGTQYNNTLSRNAERNTTMNYHGTPFHDSLLLYCYLSLMNHGIVQVWLIVRFERFRFAFAAIIPTSPKDHGIMFDQYEGGGGQDLVLGHHASTRRETFLP
jgi:hypothetical protein